MLKTKINPGKYRINVKMHIENISNHTNSNHRGSGILKITSLETIEIFMHFNKFRDEHFEGKIKNNTPNFFRLIPSDESRKELSVEIDNLNDHRLLGDYVWG